VSIFKVCGADEKAGVRRGLGRAQARALIIFTYQSTAIDQFFL
jgi:hypothetical protein